MKEPEFLITIQPGDRQLPAHRGDSLLTLLLVNGILSREDAANSRVYLARGAVSPPDDPAAEAAVFTPAELAEGWILASERRVTGEAELILTAPENEIIAQPLANGYGVALNLGAGTISGGLIDLDSMRIPVLSATGNSQLRLVAELPARRQYAAADPAHRQQLRRLLLDDMERLLGKLTDRGCITPDQIRTVTCAGNRLMFELLLDAAQESDYHQTQLRHAGELGLTLLPPDTDFYFLPGAAHGVGADIVAAALAENLLARRDANEITLLFDFSMSGEILAAGHGKLLAAAANALPFEGVGVSCGMQAMTGAITGVAIDDEVTVRTVHNGRPRGVTGAGLLAAAHALRAAGLLGADGRLTWKNSSSLPPAVGERLRTGVLGREFVLALADRNFARDISITQEDILQLQMAKGSFAAAWRALLDALEVPAVQVGSVLLTEAHRNLLKPEIVQAMGLLPFTPSQRVFAVGNAAWQGAYLSLCDRANLDEAARIAAAIERLDLTINAVYAEEFIRRMAF